MGHDPSTESRIATGPPNGSPSTGYNSTLGNKSFHFKKNRKDANKNFVGFKNGLALNADVVEADQWTEVEIEARTVKLAKRVLKLFPL